MSPFSQQASNGPNSLAETPNEAAETPTAAGSLPTDIPGGQEILNEVKGKHAHPSVVMHGLYGIYFNRKAIRYMARMLCKSPSTIHRWVKRWETDRTTGRIQNDPQFRKFSPENRSWIKDYYERFPLSFLDEAAAAFENEFKMPISRSHLWTILFEAAFTRKVAHVLRANCLSVTCPLLAC